MVTASSSTLVSKSGVFNNHVPTVSSDNSKVTSLGGLRLVKQTNAHNGLRISNPVDELHDRTIVLKSNARQVIAKSVQSNKNSKASSEITCGMNLIFVGTEVGPWSKTGGLGDVLGGLPPALAVSSMLYDYIGQNFVVLVLG